MVSLEEIFGEGRAVLLNFWGITCAPCLDEIKELNRLYREKFKGGGVEFIAVNTDGIGGEELKGEVETRNIRFNFPSLPDPDMEITSFYNAGFVPHSVVISPDGEILLEITGYNPELFGKLEIKLFEVAGER